MDYWAETMQDDAWMIASDGWKVMQNGKPNIDLIPAVLVVARYFAAEQAAIEQLEAERDAISRQIEEMIEEQGDEDGLLFKAQTEKGKITKASVKARLAAAEEGGIDVAEPDEIPLLRKFLDLSEQEAVIAKQMKEAQNALNVKVTTKYGKLSEAEIKSMVVEDKWFAAMEVRVQSELHRVSQTLTSRIRQLAERYVMPLPTLMKDVETFPACVDEQLKKMRFKWN